MCVNEYVTHIASDWELSRGKYWCEDFLALFLAIVYK